MLRPMALALALAGPVALSCGEPSTNAGEGVASYETAALVEYGNCPLPDASIPEGHLACALYHPGSLFIAYCTYERCFEMNHGGEIRVVAADELGPFPDTWFIWERAVTPPVALIPCDLATYGNKTRVHIPEGKVRCSVDVPAGQYVYHEHFASNPVTGCLGWVECRESR